MATVPVTTVRICRGIPLNNTYKDQLTFSGRGAQETYFASKAKYTANNLTYQREQMYIRYPNVYENLVDCNYLCYQNPTSGNKWFYAFITNLEYVNDEETRIYFEVDAYQTFMWDIEIKMCFVEREHVNDDSVGANLIDEGLALGDYVATSVTQQNFTNWWIVVGSTVDLRNTASFPPQGGYVYAGIYSGASYYLFDSDSWTTGELLADIIEAIGDRGKMDAIVTMYMIPKQIISGGSNGGYLPSRVRTATNLPTPSTNTLNGYKPRNNKLLCYPFRCLQVSNNEGNAVTLRYEFFRDNTPNVVYRGVPTPNGRIICYPQNYKGVTINLNESISLGNYPQCSWQNNVYGNWLAAQSIRWGYQKDRQILSNALNIGNAAGEAYMGNVVGVKGAIGVAQNTYNMLSSMQEEKEVHSIIPNSIGGTIGNGYSNVSIGKYGFTLEEKTVTAEKARSIDDYLWAFGYKVNRVKVPNIEGRPYWNYVKTIDAKVIGNAPVPFLDRIVRMLDDGVTFWHGGEYVGDYSLDNSSGSTPPPPVDTFNLTVINGEGSGAYKAYENVLVTANTVTNFQNWVSRNGGEFVDAYTTPTVFIMPPNDVTIEAIYNTQPVVEGIHTVMRGFIGAVEWDSTVGIWQRWYYGSYVKDAWCTTCLTYCAYVAGVSSQVPKNENVQRLYDQMSANGATWEATPGGRLPKEGDVLFFITSQSSTVLHHCGVVSGVNGNQIKYISGNTTNPSGGADGVFEKTTTIGQGGSYYVKYFGNVDYS